MSLRDQHCTEKTSLASPAEIEKHLQELHDWKLAADGNSISRDFRFQDYYETIAFVNALAFVAHREDHHPDLEVHYNRCLARYSTHSVGGLSPNDFICAAKLDALVAG